jgi:hypothetical protein
MMGKKPSIASVDKFNSGQTGSMNKMLEIAMSQMDPSRMSFDPIRQRLMSLYQQTVLPSIAERFTGMGNGQGSSAFLGELTGGTNDFMERMGTLESQYNQQMLPQYLRMAELGLTPLQEHMYMPGSKGMLQSGGEALMEAIPHAIAAYASGGATLPASIVALLAKLSGGSGAQAADEEQPTSAGFNPQWKGNWPLDVQFPKWKGNLPGLDEQFPRSGGN